MNQVVLETLTSLNDPASHWQIFLDFKNEDPTRRDRYKVRNPNGSVGKGSFPTIDAAKRRIRKKNLEHFVLQKN